MRKKWLALIIVVAILAVSIPVSLTLIHGGEVPPDGGGSNVPSDNTTNPSPLAILSSADGNVLVMEAGTSAWADAQVGVSLKTGDGIKTGAGSSAEITFLDGSTIKLQADTEIDIATLEISTETGSKTIQVKQAIGDTVSRVTHLIDTASSYEVETPSCVAAVRGSAMEVKVGPDGTTWVTNLEGHIVVIANGVELEVPLGRTCVITLGESPQLLPPGGAGGGGGRDGGVIPYPDIALIKMASTTQAQIGKAINYTYIVTNPGNVPLSNVSVTDDMIDLVTYESGDASGDRLLDTDESWAFTATYNVTAEDSSPLVNTAAASGTYGSQTVISWATASVDIMQPAIAISKTADSTEVHDGDIITYTYTVTNPGGIPVSGILVTDDMTDNVTLQIGDTDENSVLDADETWVFSATYNVTGEESSPLVNTATVSGIDPWLQPVTAQSTATVNVLRPGIALKLTPDPSELPSYNPTPVDITWTYNVTNTGNTPLSDLYVGGEMISHPTYQSGDTNGNSQLDTGETWIFIGHYTIAAGDFMGAGEWAWASGTDALGMLVEAAAEAYVTVIPMY
jgi:uncharacterized repeat protein (TIGR01451 family)